MSCGFCSFCVCSWWRRQKQQQRHSRWQSEGVEASGQLHASKRAVACKQADSCMQAGSHLSKVSLHFDLHLLRNAGKRWPEAAVCRPQRLEQLPQCVAAACGTGGHKHARSKSSSGNAWIGPRVTANAMSCFVACVSFSTHTHTRTHAHTHTRIHARTSYTHVQRPIPAGRGGLSPFGTC